MLHEETVAKETLALIKQFSADNIFKDFVLVGGTALALQLGHRVSLDIDLFTGKPFEIPKVVDYLKGSYRAEVPQIKSNRVVSKVNGIKVDLVSHPYPWIFPTREIDGIRMASLEDIAAMKVNAIVESGERLKDYVDLYFLLQQMPLKQVVNAYQSKYREGAEKAIRSILNHNKINFNGRVRLIETKLTWGEVAQRLREAVVESNKLFPAKESQDISMSLGARKGKGRRM